MMLAVIAGLESSSYPSALSSRQPAPFGVSATPIPLRALLARRTTRRSFSRGPVSLQ